MNLLNNKIIWMVYEVSQSLINYHKNLTDKNIASQLLNNTEIGKLTEEQWKSFFCEKITIKEAVIQIIEAFGPWFCCRFFIELLKTVILSIQAAIDYFTDNKSSEERKSTFMNQIALLCVAQTLLQLSLITRIGSTFLYSEPVSQTNSQHPSPVM